MFENIIGQERVVAEIERAVTGNKLPASLLLSGEHYSGKVSTALELARVLTCHGDKGWNCNCRSCENHRLLIHPYTQLLGSSFFIEEITACADILKREQPLYARYMFIRAVRKLLKRFDPALWEGTEPKYKQAAGSAVKAEELLREITVEGDLPERKNLHKLIDRIISECVKIASTYSSDNIPIDQIRRINSWSRTSSESVKVVVIENSDSMQESSRNSLLKLLEEPPGDCYFILTTARKGAIIPTILSRVRVLNFKPRTKDDANEVIKRIFREEQPDYRSIREYFLGRNSDMKALKTVAGRFTEAILSGNGNAQDAPVKNPGDIGDFKEIYASKRLFTLFIEEIVENIRQALSDKRISPQRAGTINEMLRSAHLQREQYNQSSTLVLESLFYGAADAAD
jgi:DNA polymerase-3 subunit gamma/tau